MDDVPTLTRGSQTVVDGIDAFSGSATSTNRHDSPAPFASICVHSRFLPLSPRDFHLALPPAVPTFTYPRLCTLISRSSSTPESSRSTKALPWTASPPAHTSYTRAGGSDKWRQSTFS